MVNLRFTINVESADGVKSSVTFETPRSPEEPESQNSGDTPGVVLITPSTSALPPGLALPISSDWSAATPA